MKEDAIYFALSFTDYTDVNKSDIVFIKKDIFSTVDEITDFLEHIFVVDSDRDSVPFSVSSVIFQGNEGVLPYFKINILNEYQMSVIEFQENFNRLLFEEIQGKGIIMTHDLAYFFYPDLYKTIGNPLKGQEILGHASIIFKD